MPTWDGFLLPVLQVLDSGQPRFRNRIGWAVSSLARAGALDRPRRGSYTVTDVGQRLLVEHPQRLDEVHLRQIPAYRDHVPARRAHVPSTTPVEESQHSSGLDRAASPDFLEQSVLDALVAMGYGGVEQRARRIGGSGDGGVDGVIDQDPLGLARIYVQAKRYAPDTVVGRPQVQGFVGALHGQQASQGVFITTSTFSREALDYARSVNASVILIDGERFANLMIDRGVGVQVEQTYAIVKLDEDYFE